MEEWYSALSAPGSTLGWKDGRGAELARSDNLFADGNGSCHPLGKGNGAREMERGVSALLIDGTVRSPRSFPEGKQMAITNLAHKRTNKLYTLLCNSAQIF